MWILIVWFMGDYYVCIYYSEEGERMFYVFRNVYLKV